MKSSVVKYCLLLTSAIVPGALCLLSSCQVYHFEYPQPADTPNLYMFPKEFRGKWRNDKKKEEVLTIRKNSVSTFGFDSVKVVNKVAGLADSLRNSHYLKYVRFNKDTGQLDTVTHYIVRGDKIYEVNDRDLLPGCSFVQKKDTLYFKMDFILDIELNQKAFLRKLTDRKYVLNIREENLAALHKGPLLPWWQIVLLELAPDHTLFIFDITPKVKNNASMIYHNDGDYYFDALWTKSELIKQANDGLFKTNPDRLHRIGNP